MAGRGQRVYFDLAVAVLAAPAGLANILAFGLGLASNGFAIRHLRAPYGGLDAEFAHHAVYDDFEVQFAHAGDQRLAGIRVGVHAEGWILLRQLAEGGAELVLIG